MAVTQGIVGSRRMIAVRLCLAVVLLTACSVKPTQPPTASAGAPTNPAPATANSEHATQTPNITSTTPATAASTPTRTHTAVPRPTLTPTAPPPPTRTIPPATLAAEATIEAFGTICEAPTADWGAEISPDGNWIAMTCRAAEGSVDSYLRVVSLRDQRAWVLHYADYAHGAELDRNDLLRAFHWSADGRYLYAASESRVSGCCWIGWYQLLVRLNLENGQQTEVVRTEIPITMDFSVSPSDRYFLYIRQDGKDKLVILDLLTYGTRVIELEFGHSAGAGYAVMSDNDEKIVLMQREYPPDPQGDLTFGSIVVIDLVTATQRQLLSGREYWDTPRPVRWTDETHVLLRGDDGDWLLDVNTAELTPVAEP